MPGLRCKRKHVACAITTEGDAARASCAREQKGHPGQHPLERAFERVNLDLHRRVFPKQNVVFEKNAGGGQFHMQRGHQFTFDVTGFIREIRGIRGSLPSAP